MKKKTKALRRPFWKNFFSNYQNALDSFALESVWRKTVLGFDVEPDEKHSPFLKYNGELGAIALSAYLDSDTDHLMEWLNSIYNVFESELAKGTPKSFTDLTPKQIAIIELESELLAGLHDYIESRCSESIDRDAVSSAFALGAGLMRLSMEDPQSDLGRYMLNVSKNRQSGKIDKGGRGHIPYDDLLKSLKEHKQAGRTYLEAEKAIVREKLPRNRNYSHYKIRARIKRRENVKDVEDFYATL